MVCRMPLTVETEYESIHALRDSAQGTVRYRSSVKLQESAMGILMEEHDRASFFPTSPHLSP